MDVLPVIDLKGGQVVRGVAGQRDRYRPIESPLVASSAPGPVAATLSQLTHHRQLYVADLDAIGGSSPAWAAYEQIMAANARLVLDAGIDGPEAARELLQFSAGNWQSTSLVVALETCAGPDVLPAILDLIGPERAVFSLDLKHGRPLTATASWRDQRAEEIARRVIEIGFTRLLVLDLAAVGVADGPNVIELCRTIAERHPDVELLAGGGVRTIEDLKQFHRAGCSGVLVASALHDGRLTAADLEAVRRLTP